MNAASTSTCQCLDCPGGTLCRCGCGLQSDATPPVTTVAGQPCTCGPRCGCDAAEQGCLCHPLQ